MWQTQRTRRPKPHPRRCAHWKLWPRDANRRRKLGPASKRTAIRARPRSASLQTRRGTQSWIVLPANRRGTQRRSVSPPNRCSTQRRSGLPRNRDSRLRRSVSPRNRDSRLRWSVSPRNRDSRLRWSVSPPNRRSTQRRSVLPRNRSSRLRRSGSPPSRRSTQSRTVPPQNRRRAQSLDSAEEQDRLPARRRRTKSQNQSGRDLGQTCAPRHLFKVDCSFTKSFVVPRGGLAQSKKINDLRVRGTPESSHTITRLSAAGVQP